jgi:xylono-1,5-lactonase
MRIIPRDHHDRLGEGLLWSDRENAVFWVDILGQRLNRLVLAGDTVTSWAVPEMIGWVIERETRPGFIAGLRSGFVALSLDPFAITPFAVPDPHPTHNRLNDAKADARGRIFAGSMATALDQPSGGFYRLDPDGRVTLLDSGYGIANGPAISPCGGFLLHTDSLAGRIYRFDILGDGELGPRRLFRQFGAGEGKPDGMTFDSAGGLWVAEWGAGRVSRFAPDGRRDRHIEVPASQASNCAFAGAGLDRMFITSAADGVDEAAGGALFEVAPGCTGVAPQRFAG